LIQVTEAIARAFDAPNQNLPEHAGPDGGPVTLEALIMASLKKE
jgi:hypothetical protein